MDAGRRLSEPWAPGGGRPAAGRRAGARREERLFNVGAARPGCASFRGPAFRGALGHVLTGEQTMAAFRGVVEI